jgi:SWI/SNF-related matrix-associated actin-dependent regulator of chromatin subfamily A member 5
VLCGRRGRNTGKLTEDMEDEELLKDEAAPDVLGHRLTAQPSVIKHGTLREYQMQGLNWLIHLYDNGINGILADEMVRLGLDDQEILAMNVDLLRCW